MHCVVFDIFMPPHLEDQHAVWRGLCAAMNRHSWFMGLPTASEAVLSCILTNSARRRPCNALYFVSLGAANAIYEEKAAHTVRGLQVPWQTILINVYYALMIPLISIV